MKTKEQKAAAVAATRTWRYLKKFGITPEEYERLAIEQGGKCALCKRSDPGRSISKRFMVDHDHITGQVRGLLCFPCNIALGYLRDDPELLERAAAYIRAARR